MNWQSVSVDKRRSWQDNPDAIDEARRAREDADVAHDAARTGGRMGSL